MCAGIGCGERSAVEEFFCLVLAQSEADRTPCGSHRCGPLHYSVLADEGQNAATRHRPESGMLVNVYALSMLSACFDHEFLDIARMGYRAVKA